MYPACAPARHIIHERVRDELFKMLLSENKCDAIGVMIERRRQPFSARGNINQPFKSAHVAGDVSDKGWLVPTRSAAWQALWRRMQQSA